MARLNGIKVEWRSRACYVDGRCGWFLTFEQWSQPVGASALAGGPPAGTISKVFAIVEFPDGVERVDPCTVEFCDDQHADLCSWQKYEDEERMQRLMKNIEFLDTKKDIEGE